MIKTPLSTVIGGAFWTPGATVINGAKLSFEAVMKKLFANGELISWHDPSDMGMMFQDAAGTVPVTGVGQAVGLMLDKSKGTQAGVELATVSSVVTNPIDPSTNTVKQYKIADVVYGKTYKISFKVSDFIGALDVGITGPITSWVDNSAVRTASNGTVICTRTFIGAGSELTLYSRSVNQCTFSDISVREVPGNHAYQTTSAARPILQNTPRRIDYDTADDKLITTLPAQLTGCTVVRAVPNVGTQILTNQTIPATYNDNTDHCGLIVINRALTATETSQITKLFNKAAGV